MLHTQNGTPAVGYIQLTSSTPTAAIPLFVVAGSATPYTLQANERVVLCGLHVSTNDTTIRLVQITDQAATPKIMASQYTVATQPSMSSPPNASVGAFGLNLKAVCAAITAGKTIEITTWVLITRN